MKWHQYPHFTDEDTKEQESVEDLYQSHMWTLTAEQE